MALRAAATAAAVRLVAALLAALLAVPAEARLAVGSVAFGGLEAGQRWHYAGKFGYAIGAGTYDLRVRLQPPREEVTSVYQKMPTASLQLEVYIDEEWDAALSLAPCRRAKDGPARKTHVLRATEDWGPWTGRVLEQKVRPHIWYFALSKCAGAGSNSTLNSTLKVDFELRMRQHDASELSVELRHMPAAMVISLFCLTGFLVRFAWLCWGFRQRSGLVHPVICTLAASVLLQWIAQSLHLGHLRVYERNGGGLLAVDASADILFMLSQVVTCTLLLLIARGYTLTPSGAVTWSWVKPLAAVVALLNVALVGHGKLQGDHVDKHHENEGAVGWTLLAVRVLLFVWFVASIAALKRTGGYRLQPFLRSFEFAGSLYFLSYPAIFLVTQVFAPYLRHPVMQTGLVATQTAAAVWLSDLFLRRGCYYEVSSLSSSLLPVGGSPMSCKDD